MHYENVLKKIAKCGNLDALKQIIPKIFVSRQLVNELIKITEHEPKRPI